MRTGRFVRIVFFCCFLVHGPQNRSRLPGPDLGWCFFLETQLPFRNAAVKVKHVEHFCFVIYAHRREKTTRREWREESAEKEVACMASDHFSGRLTAHAALPHVALSAVV